MRHSAVHAWLFQNVRRLLRPSIRTRGAPARQLAAQGGADASTAHPYARPAVGRAATHGAQRQRGTRQTVRQLVAGQPVMCQPCRRFVAKLVPSVEGSEPRGVDAETSRVFASRRTEGCPAGAPGAVSPKEWDSRSGCGSSLIVSSLGESGSPRPAPAPTRSDSGRPAMERH